MKNTILALFLALFMGVGCDELGNFTLDDIPFYSENIVQGVIIDSSSNEGIAGVHLTHKWLDVYNFVHYENLDYPTGKDGKFSFDLPSDQSISYLLIDTVLLNEYRSDGYVNGTFKTSLFQDGIEIKRALPNYYRIVLVKK